MGQYIHYLKDNGISCFVFPCIPNKYYLPNNRKITVYFVAITKIINRSIGVLLGLFFDIIFLQRNLLPWDKLFTLEKVLKKFNKKVIFDFDDAIYLNIPYNFAEVAKLSDTVIAGNRFLKSKVLEYNSNILIIPTPVDTDKYVPAGKRIAGKEIVIGWMGSSSGLVNIDIVMPAIKRLHRNYKIVFKIISDKPAQKAEIKANSCFQKWSEKSEVADIQSMDIGIMPLYEDELNKGKCGFKILLYMACAIPAVASPVGCNKEIINDSANGFLAATEEEWYEKLERLIEDAELRNAIGVEGRKTAESSYSLKVNAPKLLEIIRDV